MIAGILLLAGSSERAKLETPKQFLVINNKELFQYSLDTMLSLNFMDEIVLVVPKNHENHVKTLLNSTILPKTVHIIDGGNTRQESVFNALNFLKDRNCEYVFIHDAARPLVSKSVFENERAELKKHDCVTAYSKIHDSICSKNDNEIVDSYLERDKIVKIETPQAFKFAIILKSHEEGKKLNNLISTDDASLAKKFGHEIKLVENDNFNFKVTTQADVELLKRLLKN